MASRFGRVALCAWATFGGLLLVVQGAVFSDTESLVKFSRCLVDRIGSSPYFDLADRSSLRDVAEALIGSMGDPDRGPRGPSSRKVMAVALVTSASDIIVLEDSERNAARTGAYRTALNDCSLASVGYVDVPFVSEAVRILETLESNKSQQQEGGFFGEAPWNGKAQAEGFGGFDSSGFAPSPVQMPPIVSDFSNQKTSFVSSSASAGSLRQTQFNYPTGSFQSEVSQTNLGSSDFRPQPSQFRPNSNSGMQGQSDGSESGSFSSAFQESYPNRQTSQAGGGFDHTQTKDSSVLMSRPEMQSRPFQLPPMPETEGNAGFASMTENPSPPVPAPQPPIPSPINIGDEEPLVDIPLPEAYTLEEVISSVLLNSTSFTNAFGSETDKQQAINKAILITQLSLSGYDDEIVAEALNAVSAAISTIPTFTPEAYAAAISTALATVLKLHNISLFAGGESLASGIGASLSSPAEGGNPPPAPDIPDYSSYQWPQPVPMYYDFQSPPLAPESVAGDIFSRTLGEMLAQSPSMTAYFCGSDPADLQTVFMLLKSALSDYSVQVSSIAASTISSTLVELTPEAACLGYPRVMSDTIAELLYENDLLQKADPVALAKKFDDSLGALRKPLGDGPEPTKSSAPVTSISSSTTSASESDGSSLSLQSSSVSSSMTSGQSSTTTEGKRADIETPPPNNSYQTEPQTTSVPLQISDQDLATTLSLFDALTSPAVTETESPTTKYPPVNQKEIAKMLFDEIRSVLEAMSEQTDESQTYLPPYLEELWAVKPVSSALSQEAQDSTDAPVVSDSPTPRGRKTKDHPRRGRNKHKRGKTTTVNPSTTDSSADFDEDFDDTESSNASEISRSQHPSYAPSQISNQPERSSGEQQPFTAPQASNQPVELRPSFQVPIISDSIPTGETSSVSGTSSTSGITPSFSQSPKPAEGNADTPVSPFPKLRAVSVSSSSVPSAITPAFGQSPKPAEGNANSPEYYPLPKLSGVSASSSSVTSAITPAINQSPQAAEGNANTPESPLPKLGTVSASSSSSSTSKDESTRAYAQTVSMIATSTIAYIRTDPSFNIKDLCSRLNDLAVVVGIPPLDNCTEVPMIDYLLNVLGAVVQFLRSA